MTDEKEEMASTTASLNYRRYTIEEIEEATQYFSKSLKVGEGGYGPVFKCHLDHTPVAVKVLRPDAAQGRSQFQQEVWIQAWFVSFKVIYLQKRLRILVFKIVNLGRILVFVVKWP